MVADRKVPKNIDDGCFVDEGGGPSNPKESLPILLEGRIPLVTPKKKDGNTTSRGGEER